MTEERSDFAPVRMSQRLVSIFTDEEIDELLEGRRVAVGAGVYRVCGACLYVVRLNKPIIGSLHVCEASRRRRKR